jgi:hypothetical protein
MSSPTLAAPHSGVANPTPALTPDLFLHHMTAMKEHYQSGSSAIYDLPNHLLIPLVQSNVGGVPQGALAAAPKPVPSPAAKARMDAILKKGGTDTKALAKRQTDFVNAQASKLKATHDTSDFAKKMEAQKAQAKADANKQIDDQFNQLIKVGTEHPELQQPIMSASQRIGAFFTGLLAKVGAFFLDIYHKIVQWINSAVDWIKGAAADAAHWLSNVGGEIVSFFGGLF